MIGALARGLGRILFAAIFILAAANHMQDISGTGKKIHKTFPAELVGGLDNAVMIACGLMGVGGVLIATGLLPRLGSLCVLAFLVPGTYFTHFLNMQEAEGEKKGAETIQVLKNVALIGAALLLFGYE